MEPITLMGLIVFGIAAATGLTTFVITKNMYDDKHENLKAQINNQLIINAEKDNAHEYSQTVFIVLLAIVTSCITVYICFKCALNAYVFRNQRRERPVTNQLPAVQNPAFEA